MNDKIKFSVSIKINRALSAVYHSFADNKIMSQYFTTDAGAPITKAGETIKWKWGKEEADVIINEVIENKSVAFRWKGYKVDYDVFTLFEFTYENGHTNVKVTEEGWNKDDAGIESSLANCSGWENMLCCMKAWTEHNIDLRK
jgi:uncharacterized protein YndB with AHSA1/START domain